MTLNIFDHKMYCLVDFFFSLSWSKYQVKDLPSVVFFLFAFLCSFISDRTGQRCLLADKDGELRILYINAALRVRSADKCARVPFLP